AAARRAATSSGPCADAAMARPPGTRPAAATSSDVPAKGTPAADTAHAAARGPGRGNAACPDREGDVEPVIDPEGGARRRGHGAQRPPELGQRATGQIFLTQLDGDPLRRQAR